MPTLADEIAALIDTIISGERAALKYGPMSALYEHNQNCLRSALARLESVPAMIAVLKTIEKVLAEDTNAEDHPCCGWGPLLAEVRSVLPPEPQEGE